MGRKTSPEEPLPVQEASRLVGAWIERLGEIWVEGQIAQLNRRQTTAWITLRDADAAVSIPVMAPLSRLKSNSGQINEGDRVVVRAKPTYFKKNGQLQWRGNEFRAVGIGDLLARIEELKRLLAAEGLFAAERKRPLPFLPQTVGLISGRGSAARRDVEENARRRWPSVQFDVREVAVQGPKSAIEVSAAIVELQSVPGVDVIVIARGGGSMEDLLPFSNETMIRAAADCRIPIVSAIGHEVDTPLLDLVADLRASTPTDAAKRIVPDMATEARDLKKTTERLRSSLAAMIDRERKTLGQLTSRPVMAQPAAIVTQQRERLHETRQRSTRAFNHRLRNERTAFESLNRHRVHVSPARAVGQERTEIARLTEKAQVGVRGMLQREAERLNAASSRLRSMSPQSTLDRGYALVRLKDGTLLRDADQVTVSATLDTRLARGSVKSVVIARESGPRRHEPEPEPEAEAEPEAELQNQTDTTDPGFEIPSTQPRTIKE